ncbi:ARM repeat-containing protein [Pseudovirgaria hyperparasitica]|uniref:ARM repeat-containing protein n=1 Tax=Pseudovirgaria hyperparasitica TaxID=470096 RepID=A0A6A6VZB2_9PEZI|nr:ARM repeat-containing protein [Pseudovirgaria hyperparasitica]KAF2755643.1 ARM repeat-containing protein [Pseudovirgaria hyperparasitica]
MVRAAAPSALHELRNSTSPETQINALKQLKNEIVGHDQRKERVIRHGGVAVLAVILSRSMTKGTGTLRIADGSKSLAAGSRGTEPDWSENDEIRLQITLIIGSLALAGPAYVPPLLNGGVVELVMELLSPSKNPSKLVAAALRTLNVIADVLSLDRLVDTSDTSSRARFLSCLYSSKSVIDSLHELLSRQYNTLVTRTEVSLTAQLIHKTCSKDVTQLAVVKSSVMDSLAFQLATRLSNVNAAQDTVLVHLLDAISTVMGHSNYRRARFLYSNAISGLTPILKSPFSGCSTNGNSAPEHASHTAVTPKPINQDQLGIPNIPSTHSKPPVHPELLSDPVFASIAKPHSKDDFDRPIFTWLLHIARQGQGLTRLAAIKVVASLSLLLEDYPALVTVDHKAREKTFSLLLIPLVVRMIEDADNTVRKHKGQQDLVEARKILPDALLVLGRMICHSPSLQRAAVDAKSIPMICEILKNTFDSMQTVTKPMWRSDPSEGASDDLSVDPTSSTLGDTGLSLEFSHALMVRLAALEALASIANKEDDYRKAIIEAGVMPCVTNALVPFQDGLPPSTLKVGPKDGNPTAVLISACKTATAMSRSVGILRTSLIDCGIAMPIMNLLQHSDINVQIAGTEVLCNLMLFFSPMRDGLLQSGALKTLCRNAHSANKKMRLLSLWALKHAVMQSDDGTKIRCLDELGTGWLTQALTGDSSDSANSVSGHSRLNTQLGMGTSNAAGEQVDILNTPDESSMDIDDDDEVSSDGESGRHFGDPARLDPSSRLLPPPRQIQFETEAELKRRQRLIKTYEMDPAVRARKIELQIQAQALDFIRNIIGDAKGNYELIDHILQTITPGRFFDILTAKLRPPSSNALSLEVSKSTSQRENLAPPNEQTPEILLSTIQVLVHIANGRPSQRSLLISHSTLLTLLLPYFRHPNPEIRVAMLWLNNNLTWLDDSGEASSARQRALDLRNAGWENAVKGLVADGMGNLDCKERAKTCMQQYHVLLNENRGTESVMGQGPMERGHRGLEHSRPRWGQEGSSGA